MLGTIIASAEDIGKLDGFDRIYIGKSLPEGEDFYLQWQRIEQDKALSAWLNTLESVFPLNAEPATVAENVNFVRKAQDIIISPVKFAAPNVFIPVFPGTNCEYDTAKRFEEQGARVRVFVIKNANVRQIEESVEEMWRRLSTADRFSPSPAVSGATNPGSGKFIATTSEPRISESVNECLRKKRPYNRICNAFRL